MSRRLLLALACTACAVALPPVAPAIAGTITRDATFGAAGLVATTSGQDEFLLDAADLGDGRTIGVGRVTQTASGLDVLVAVWDTATGTLDADVGTGGEIALPIAAGNGADYAAAVAVRGTQVAVFGTTATDLFVQVYDVVPGGALTPDADSGGGDGLVTFSIVPGTQVEYASDGLALADGWLILGACGFSSAPNDHALCGRRLDADLSLAATWTAVTDPIATVAVSGTRYVPQAIDLTPAGTVAVAGSVVTTGTGAEQPILHEVTLTGTATGPGVTSSRGLRWTDVVVEPDGDVDVVGPAPNNATGAFDSLLARYRSGALATDFGSGGYASVHASPRTTGLDNPQALALTGAGDLLIAGHGQDGATFNDYSPFVALVAGSDGAPVTAFADGAAAATFPLGTATDLAFDVLPGSDGRVQVIGAYDSGGGDDDGFALGLVATHLRPGTGPSTPTGTAGPQGPEPCPLAPTLPRPCADVGVTMLGVPVGPVQVGTAFPLGAELSNAGPDTSTARLRIDLDRGGTLLPLRFDDFSAALLAGGRQRDGSPRGVLVGPPREAGLNTRPGPGLTTIRYTVSGSVPDPNPANDTVERAVLAVDPPDSSVRTPTGGWRGAFTFRGAGATCDGSTAASCTGPEDLECTTSRACAGGSTETCTSAAGALGACTAAGTPRRAAASRRGGATAAQGGPAPTALARIELAVLRTAKGAGAAAARCRWLTGPRATFSGARPVKGRCATPRWLRAKGTSAWTYRLRRALPPGRYVLYVRATSAGGFRESSFSGADRNLVRFTVR